MLLVIVTILVYLFCLVQLFESCRDYYNIIGYQGPEVRSGDLPQPITLITGQEFTFTIQRGVGTADCVSVNYDDFVNDVAVGDMLLVDGMLCTFFFFRIQAFILCTMLRNGIREEKILYVIINGHYVVTGKFQF